MDHFIYLTLTDGREIKINTKTFEIIGDRTDLPDFFEEFWESHLALCVLHMALEIERLRQWEPC